MNDSTMLPIVASLLIVWAALVMYEIGFKLYTWWNRRKG